MANLVNANAANAAQVVNGYAYNRSLAKILRFFEIKRYFFRKNLANVPANVPNFCKRFKYFQ